MDTIVSSGATKCELCPTGTWSNNAITECSPYTERSCSSGFELSGRTSWNDHACTECGAGTYVTGGTLNAATNQRTWVATCTGTATGGETCDLDPNTDGSAFCPAGCTYTGSGPTCTDCGAGKYTSQDPAPAEGSVHYGKAVARATYCTDCPQGWYDDDEDSSTDCIACGPNNQTEDGSSNFVQTGATHCEACGVGKWDHDASSNDSSSGSICRSTSCSLPTVGNAHSLSGCSAQSIHETGIADREYTDPDPATRTAPTFGGPLMKDGETCQKGCNHG